MLEPRSRLHVIVTMRADFTDRPLEYIDFGELMRQRTEFILPLTPDELEQAISGPAKRVGLLPESGLVSHIVREVGDQPGALPLLQYALTELFEQRQGRKLTLEAYKHSGGVSGALARRAEQIYSGLNEAEREAARQLFLRLVTLGEASEDTRRRVLRSELEALTLSQTDGRSARSLLETALDHYGRYRLLTFGFDPITRGPTVEVAHEALLREWPRLRAWLESGRADLRMQRTLALAAAEWQGGGNDASFLLRGARLEQFDAWSGSSQLALTLDEQEFLSASLAQHKAEQAAEEERREREARLRQTRQRLGQALIVVLAVALLIASGLSIYAWQQRQLALNREQTALNERQAAQRQAAILLAAQSETELQNGYFDRAVLLALETLENYPYTAQAENALGRAVSYNRALQACSGLSYPIAGAAWSPDGQRFASIGINNIETSDPSYGGNQLIIWEADTCQRLRTIDLPIGITGYQFDGGLAVRWTPDGKRLVALHGDRHLYGSQGFDLSVWDADSGEMLSITDIPNQAEAAYKDIVLTTFPTGNGIDLAPGSERLATLGGDNTALIWDAAYQKSEVILKGHEDDVNSVAWSPDGARLATSSQDGTVRIWDAASGETQIILQQAHTGGATQALWSPDGGQLATAGQDGKVCLWDAANGEQIHCFEASAGVKAWPVEIQSVVWSLAWAPDGKRLASGHGDGSVRLWDSASGQLLVTLRGHNDKLVHLAWEPDSQHLLSTDFLGKIRVWNAAPSIARLTLETGHINASAYTSDGRYMAVGIGDNMFWTVSDPHLAIWDMTTAQEITHQLNPDFADYHWVMISYSPDNTKLLATGMNKPYPDFSSMATAYIFDVSSGKLLNSFPVDSDSLITQSAWSPDGSQIATPTLGRKIWIWDANSGQLVTTLLHGSPDYTDPALAYQAQWSPDGTKLLTTSDIGGAWVWDTKTWTKLFAYTGQGEYVTQALWSPDGKRVMSSTAFGGDMSVRVWDGATGEELLIFNKHTSLPNVAAADWAPDGKRATTSDQGGKTLIWDTTTGDVVLSLDEASGRWSPNGKDLFAGGGANQVDVWRVWQTTEELLAYAKECCVFRQLTPAEREQFGLPAAEAAGAEATGAEGTLPTPTPAPEATPGAVLPALPIVSTGLLALALVWRQRK